MFSGNANWIWIARTRRPYNTYACFRRTFSARRTKRATLRITADSRYDVFINGHWLGHGPTRSWPSPWPVDEYAIGHLLRDGDNVIAVLVTHFNIDTFQ